MITFYLFIILINAKKNIVQINIRFTAYVYLYVFVYFISGLYGAFIWLKSNLAFILTTDRLIVCIVTQE